MGRDTDDTGADLGLKIAGQEINVRNVKSLNTIATVCTLVAVCGMGVALYYHEAAAQQDKSQLAKTLEKSNADIATALKDANVAQREQNTAFLQAMKELTAEQRRSTEQITIGNCMNESAMKNRQDARETCRRIVRDNR